MPSSFAAHDRGIVLRGRDLPGALGLLLRKVPGASSLPLNSSLPTAGCRAAGSSDRTRAHRRRVRTLGVHPVQDAAARPRATGRCRPGRPAASTPALDWPGLRDYRDCMIRHLDDTAEVRGYEQAGATVIKGAAPLAGPGRVEVDGADHIVIATGSQALRPPSRGGRR